MEVFLEICRVFNLFASSIFFLALAYVALIIYPNKMQKELVEIKRILKNVVGDE